MTLQWREYVSSLCWLLPPQTLECPMLIWSGITLVDVAFIGQSELFLEKCCRSVGCLHTE